MNKLFTKIAALALGMTMATGVGVAVAASSKEASQVHAAAGDTFSLASSIAANDEITFVGINSSTYYSSAAQANNNRSGVAVTYSNSKITAVATTSIFKVEADANNDGYWNFKDTSTNKYLYNASSSSKSYLRSGDTVNADTYRWSVSISNGVATISSKSTNRPNIRFNYNNGSPLFNCYATGQNDVYIYKKDAAKTLSSITVSNNHRSFTVGDTFVKETVTAHYSDSSTATVTNSATFSGYNMSTAGNQTVSVSYSDTYGSASTTYSITVTAATTPTITLNANSFSGFTGQSFSVTATYSNLTSAFAWTTSGAGTTTESISSTGTSLDGTSTYSGTLTGAGTKILTATGGGVTSGDSQKYTISITKVTVDITKASTSIAQGKNETLVASHNASAVDGLTWTSSDTSGKIAVDANGKVTVDSNATVGATATITATSKVDTSVSDTCTVTVTEAPLVYEIAFGSTKNPQATELTTSTFLSVFSVDSNISCSAISKMYATNNTNQLKVGSGSYAGTVTLSIPSNQYFVSVEAVIATGANLNLQVQSGASGSTLEAQNVTSAGTYTFDDYLSSEESNTVTISTSKSGAIYLTELNLYYAVKTPTITVDTASHSIRTNETAVSTVTIANFASTPTLEYNIQSGSSSISTVVIGAISNNQATVTITPSSTAGTAVVRIRDHANPSLYYVDITVVVSEVPSYYMVLDAYTDTGTNYGYKGGVVEIDVTDSNLAGDIEWEVTSGSVSGASSDNDGFIATISSVGTLTIVATDDGDNTNTETVSITVVDSLNTVMAASETPHASTLTFTAAAGGSGTADDGATWTVTSDAEEQVYEEARGIHFGTNKTATVQYVQLVSSNVASGASNTIRSVVVNTTDAAGTADLTVTVGSTSFKCEGETSTAVSSLQSDYTFSGTGTGTVTVRVDRGSSQYKGIYVKSIVVNYVTAGEESDIANAVGMHLAQKAVIDYAKDFNDTLEAICVAYGSTDTSDLEDAWSDLETQYTNWFTNSGKSLTDDEKAHAKLLFANASSVDRNVTASADELQHMLAKYDWIVGHYSNCLDFLNTDPGTGRDPVAQASGRTVLNTIMQDSNTVAIIVIISMISAFAVGGYFFIRKRKEN